MWVCSVSALNMHTYPLIGMARHHSQPLEFLVDLTLTKGLEYFQFSFTHSKMVVMAENKQEYEFLMYR